MPICGKITSNLLYSCDTPSIGGVEANLYLFNRDEVAGYVRNGTNPQIIEGITMATGKLGFKFEGFNTSVKPKVDLVKKEFSTRYDHVVSFLIFARGSNAKKQIEGLANGKYIAVIENVQKTGDSAFEVLGTDIGLELRTLTGDANDQNNEGAYALELGSPENFKEPHMPATLFKTDYATTKSTLNALITV
jgi:hypothetical protein